MFNKLGLLWFFLLLVLVSFGCSHSVITEEASVEIAADTFQVKLHVDDAVGLPPLLIFDDESPREAAQKRGTGDLTIGEVVRTRYPGNKYEIIKTERTGDRFRVTIKKIN